MPGRIEAKKRLMSSLFPYKGDYIPIGVCEDKGRPHEWSRTIWEWQLEQGSDFCLTLADDSIVAPNFWEILQAMLVHLPKRAVLGWSHANSILMGPLWRVMATPGTAPNHG